MIYSRVYDPVHKFITLTPLEDLLIQSEPFERLRYIHQCGSTFFVYPGATHKRYEHSLGVMKVATMIYETLVSNVDQNFFQKLNAKSILNDIPKKGSTYYDYWKQVLRLACLCHDLGHLPFSHVAEKNLLRESSHEYWTYKIIHSSFLDSIFAFFQKQAASMGIQREVRDDVAKIAVGPKPYLPEAEFTPWQRVLSSILTDDFFGADRIDYLLRDAQSTGLVYGNFDYHQLIQMLRLAPQSRGAQMSLELGVLENGLASCEALQLSRHFMFKKIYNYPSIKAFDFHLSRFMKNSFSHITKDIASFIACSDVDVLVSVKKAAKEPSHPGYLDALCLRGGSNALRAMILPDRLREESLVRFQKQYNIASHDISWACQTKGPDYVPMSALVIKENGELTRASKESSISIPSVKHNWFYIAKKHQDKFLTFSALAKG